LTPGSKSKKLKGVPYVAQMHDLLELAAEKRARGILQISRRIGLVAKPVASEQFDQELEGL